MNKLLLAIVLIILSASPVFGACGDAGEDELAFRWRYASAGSWAGPGESGASYWSNWVAEVDTRNIQAFATEPDTDDIKVGIIAGTFDQAVWVDDLEISNAKPSW